MQLSIVRLALMVAAVQLVSFAASESAVRDAGRTHCVGTIRLSDSCVDAHSAIQDAITHTRPGDTVLVAPGDYYEHLVITTDAIRLIGSTNSEGEAASVLQDVYSPEQITIKDASSVEVANFILMRKSGRANGPVGFENSRANTIHHVTVDNTGGLVSLTAEAESTALGVSGNDDDGNQFWSVIVWQRQSGSRAAEEKRRDLLAPAWPAVSQRRERSDK